MKNRLKFGSIQSMKMLLYETKAAVRSQAFFSVGAVPSTYSALFSILCYVMTTQNKFKFIIHWIKTNNTQKISEPDNVVECIHCKHNWQAACCTIVFGSSKGEREEAFTHALIFP